MQQDLTIYTSSSTEGSCHYNKKLTVCDFINNHHYSLAKTSHWTLVALSASPFSGYVVPVSCSLSSVIVFNIQKKGIVLYHLRQFSVSCYAYKYIKKYLSCPILMSFHNFSNQNIFIFQNLFIWFSSFKNLLSVIIKCTTCTYLISNSSISFSIASTWLLSVGTVRKK